MPVLIRYILIRMSLGFALGAGAAVALMLLAPGAVGSPSRLLEAMLIIYGLGSTFALGYLATALASDDP